MKSLKNHLSLIIPLFAIFFAIEFYFIIDKIIDIYEKNLKEDYTILVVSKKKLKSDVISGYVDLAKMEEIEPKKMIEKLKKDNLNIDFNTLKLFMPKFYKIYLNHFPSSFELKKIKGRLSQIDGVERVETFSKSHTKIYNLLITLKQISKIFVVMIAIMSFLLILKQIRVWHLEHRERMYIMELFGAPFWMRSGVLIRLTIVDTVISLILLITSYYYLLNSSIFKDLFDYINIKIEFYEIFENCLLIGAVGLVATLVSVFIVSSRQIER